MRLKNKVAIVTGGAGGIGRSITRLFALEGAKVYAADIKRKEGENQASELSVRGDTVRFVMVDVTNEEDLKKLLDEVKKEENRLDVIVNNAGVFLGGGILNASVEEWERCISIDLKSVWGLVKLAFPMLQETGNSAVINISSMHAFQTSPEGFPYSVVKTAVVGLTRSMAVELGKYGIRVNAICPGLIETRMSAEWINRLKREGKWQRLLHLHPLGRIGEPEDVAKAALFFAADDSAFITGTHLFVDGGHHALLWDFNN
jgi:NAD(P)-dependent dehydrogenase (short-subunit alcohol dehydrogenase family)